MAPSKLNSIAQAIVDFEENHHLTDTELGLASGFAVERLHALKSMETAATDTEIKQLGTFFKHNASNEHILAE